MQLEKKSVNHFYEAYSKIVTFEISYTNTFIQKYFSRCLMMLQLSIYKNPVPSGHCLMLYEDVLLLGKDIKEQRRTTREELKSMHDFPACPFIVMFQVLIT